MEQLEGSFEAYVESIERKFAGPGIAKIVPPKGWTPRKKGYAKVDIQIPQPIKQLATGSRGLYRLLLVQGKAQSLAKDFRPMATDKDNAPPCTDSREELERHYWRNLTLRPPHYGADIEGSLFDRGLKGWNLRHLDSLLTRTLKKKKISLPGCNTPMLYFGMWRSTFAWHTEDVDLASVNYLHYGAPKAWYCIPPEHRERFERMLKGILPDLFRSCPEFMRHKELMVSPEFLRLHSIPVVKVMQYPGEFILNAPGAYHAGFNCGYNCAESVNFATKRWIITGAVAEPCRCNEDSIQIDMSMFLDAASGKARQAILDAQGESSSDSDSEDEGEDSDDESGAASHSESGNAQRKAGRPGAKGKAKLTTSGSRTMAQAAESSSSSPAAQTTSRKRGRPAEDVSTETSAKRLAAAAARAERAQARASSAASEGRRAIYFLN
ncbi:hypothetical protein WJX73_004683 [Symbiochloris irregularis]|uniref:Uncharacterized protein n=1 Tax=Symbiochloris irregularis TaxID=706552 RepID=A0AAW1PPC8_9CHLO